MVPESKDSSKHWAGRLGIFTFGLILGGIAYAVFQPEPPRTAARYLRLEDGSHPLIGQLLTCNINETTPSVALEALQERIRDDIGRLTETSDIDRAGVYVRGLENGTWTAVNGDELFVPASLMKIVKLIAILNEADQTPEILDRSVTIPLNLSASEQHIAPTASAVRGETYSVRNLLEYAIIHSDNVASNALSSVVNPDILNQTLSDLEIPEYDDFDDAGTYTISPRLYSRFFRMLYNSTLLSPEHSELALEWLKGSEYKEAIVKGVNDATIVVAHKFGEAIIENNEKAPTYQHHDCGIVYQESPYVLCVMTEGKNLDRLAKAIADITQDVDTFMQTQ